MKYNRVGIMTKSSVDRKRSKYGEKYTLRFHKRLKTYDLTCNDGTPHLIAKFVETDGDLATRLWEILENNYKENEQLKQQLNYIQNSISEHIKHQKTELGQKALKEIIEDYNEWLLGHKELQE